MLMKIGDITSRLGISHRSLHYWESAGILHSTRGEENDYRYYDEENMQKIKQIILLRKLRLSIPSIQEIFVSDELSKVIAVFTDHLNETKKETEQLNALGIVLRQLLNMLKDHQDMGSVYQYLDTTHSTESEELKSALKTVLSEPIKEIAVESQPEPIVDMKGVDLSLELVTEHELPEITNIIKRCYAGTSDMEKLLYYWDFRGINMPDCRVFYKIMQSCEIIGAINLAYVGMEAMLIRCLAYNDPDNNIYLFELLKQKYPQILCWMICNATDNDTRPGIEDFNYDWEGKKQRFWEDNGFTFYTDARYNQYIKMMKPHDEVYKSSRYRFALLDDSMNNVSFRFFGLGGLDFYDGAMPNWRVTDCYFADTLIYDSTMMRSRFYDSGLDDCDFRYAILDRSVFAHCSFKDCTLTDCDITGMTVDGVSVADAILAYTGDLKQKVIEKADNPGPWKPLVDQLNNETTGKTV